jgi:hypothetical protein
LDDVASNIGSVSPYEKPGVRPPAHALQNDVQRVALKLAAGQGGAVQVDSIKTYQNLC